MREWTRAQALAGLVGLAFLLVGLLGFIPGITTDYDRMGFADHDGARLLGIFGVNVLHNLIHLVLGAAGVASALAHRLAWRYLLAGGAAYLAVFVYGVAVDLDGDANVAALNTADNGLHLALAAIMIVAGALTARRATRPMGQNKAA